MAAYDGPAATPGGEPCEALYLYCLARTGALPALEDPAIEGEIRLGLTPFKDVVAVVGVASVDDFCGPSAEARMGDVAWVASRVYRHHAVVKAVMRHSAAVVPVRFAVLFSSPERLQAWLETHYDAISRALDRLASHEEWAVKVTLDRRSAEARLLEGGTEGHDRQSSASAGAHYLSQRSARAAVGAKLDAWLHGACTEIVGSLLQDAAEFREREVLCGSTGADGRPVANWAFLVPQRGREAFAARVESVDVERAEWGLRLVLSGPWPPYSFCPSLESDTDLSR